MVRRRESPVRRIKLILNLTVKELGQRFRRAREPVERVGGIYCGCWLKASKRS
jgi:hypothetical protein